MQEYKGKVYLKQYCEWTLEKRLVARQALKEIGMESLRVVQKHSLFQPKNTALKKANEEESEE